MKKYICFIFFLLSFFSFSKNIDSAQSRQTALQEMERWFVNKTPYKWGETDCSHYVQAGMSKAGLKLPTGAAHNGRYTQSIWNSDTKKIPAGSTNLLKPGDLVFFNRSNANGIGHVGMVFENPSAQCGGGPLIIDTYTSKKPPRKMCLSQHTGYVGAISHDEIIRANGHTPVNTDGTVITPEGITGDLGAGGMIGYNKDFTRNISFDDIAIMFQEYIIAGVMSLIGTLIPLLTIIFLIDFAIFGINSYLVGMENFFKELILRFLKFMFFAYVVKNAIDLMQMVYEVFLEAAKTLSGVKPSIDAIVDLYINTNKELFDSMMNYQFNVFDMMNSATMIFMLLVIVIAIAIAYLQICYEIFSTTIIFFIAVGMSLALFPLKVAKFSEKYGTNPLSTAFSCGIKLIVTLIMVGVAQGLLEKVVIKENMVKDMDFLQLFTILAYSLIVCFLVR